MIELTSDKKAILSLEAEEVESLKALTNLKPIKVRKPDYPRPQILSPLASGIEPVFTDRYLRRIITNEDNID